jgi:hypothetical protein
MKMEEIINPFETLIKEGLNREVLLWTFFTLRIQSLWAHTHGMWLYTKPTNPTRESPNERVQLKVWA